MLKAWKYSEQYLFNFLFITKQCCIEVKNNRFIKNDKKVKEYAWQWLSESSGTQ